MNGSETTQDSSGGLAVEFGGPIIPFKSSDPALIYGLIWP